MPGNLQPLDQKFAIVDQRGNPTEYFIRWAQQKQIDIQGSVDAAQALEIATDYVLNYLLAHKLQEGSGIQITPDGNISNSPLIAADAQEILDQISATRGVILYRGLLGWAALTPGTAGYVLSTGGAGADPSWIAAGGGGGGGFPLLEQHTAAVSATLDFTTAISSTYDQYLIEFVDIVPATNAVSLLMRMSTDGGATYDAGGNYSWSAVGTNRFGQAQAGADSGATSIPCHYSTTGNNTTAGYNGECRLFSPGSTTKHKKISGTCLHLPDNVTVQNDQFGGYYRSLTAVNAFRFLYSGGNITSGIIRVYGIPK